MSEVREDEFLFEEGKIYYNTKMRDVEFYLVEAWLRENTELWFRGYWLAISDSRTLTLQRDTFVIHYPEDWVLVNLVS